MKTNNTNGLPRLAARERQQFHPLQLVQQQIASLADIPRGCCLAEMAKQQTPIMAEQLSYGFSGDKSRAYFSYILPCPLGSDGDKVVFDIWDLTTMRLISQFSSLELAQYKEGSNTPGDGTAMNLRRACFLDNDHLLVSTMIGEIQLFAITSGKMIWQQQIGDLLCGLSACQESDIFAVSIFPRQGYDAFNAACGIKIFSISSLVQNHELQLLEFISPDFADPPFSILPNRLRFAASGQRLLLQGAAIRSHGYTDYVEISDCTNTPAITIHERDNKAQIVESSIAANHHVLVIEADSYTFFDGKNRAIAQGDLPPELQDGCRSCRISDDGRQGVAWLKGVVFLLAPDQTPRRILADLGYILDIFWSGANEVIAFVYYYDRYVLKRIDLTSMTILAESVHPEEQPLEEVMPRAVAFSHDGRFFLGDRQGGLRTYDASLRLLHRQLMANGPINQLVADGFQDRIAILQTSQQIQILQPADNSLSQYYSRTTGEPVSSGYGVKSTHYPLLAKGELIFEYSKRNLGFQVDDIRRLSVSKGSTRLAVLEKAQMNNSGSEVLARCIMPAAIMAICHCQGYAILALADGRLLALVGDDMRIEPIAGEDVGRLAMDNFQEIMTLPAVPQGLAWAGEGYFSWWTSSAFGLVGITKGLRKTATSQRPVAKVQNMVFDPCGERLVCIMEHHLAFYDRQLMEMYRLYPLADGKGIIHVPYPGQDNQQDQHPGFYWSTGKEEPDLGLFQLLDKQGKPLEMTPERQDLVRQHYCNEFMVNEALDDYQGFCALLHDGADSPVAQENYVKLSA